MTNWMSLIVAACYLYFLAAGIFRRRPSYSADRAFFIVPLLLVNFLAIRDLNRRIDDEVSDAEREQKTAHAVVELPWAEDPDQHAEYRANRD